MMKKLVMSATLPICVIMVGCTLVLVVSIALLGRSMHRDSLRERLQYLKAEKGTVERHYDYNDRRRHRELSQIWRSMAYIYFDLGEDTLDKFATEQAAENDAAWKKAMDDARTAREQ